MKAKHFPAVFFDVPTRAQALATEHVNIAQTNLVYALERPEASIKMAPAFRLVAEAAC